MDDLQTVMQGMLAANERMRDAEIDTVLLNENRLGRVRQFPFAPDILQAAQAEAAKTTLFSDLSGLRSRLQNSKNPNLTFPQGLKPH